MAVRPLTVSWMARDYYPGVMGKQVTGNNENAPDCARSNGALTTEFTTPTSVFAKAGRYPLLSLGIEADDTEWWANFFRKCVNHRLQAICEYLAGIPLDI